MVTRTAHGTWGGHHRCLHLFLVLTLLLGWSCAGAGGTLADSAAGLRASASGPTESASASAPAPAPAPKLGTTSAPVTAASRGGGVRDSVPTGPPGADDRPASPATLAALEAVRRNAEEVQRLTDDVHAFAHKAVAETEQSVILATTQAARDEAGRAAVELETAIKALRSKQTAGGDLPHQGLETARATLLEVARDVHMLDSTRLSRLETAERQLFGAPQLPSVERAIEYVESARREVDIAMIERTLAGLAKNPAIAQALTKLRELHANSLAQQRRQGQRRGLSRREQVQLVEQVLAGLGGLGQGEHASEVSDAHALATDIKHSLGHARTTMARELRKVERAMDELANAPKSGTVERARDIVADVERALSDPRVSTKAMQKALADAEHMLATAAEASAAGGPARALSGDAHITAAFEALREARHDEEIDEARVALELTLARDSNDRAQEALFEAEAKLRLVQEHSHGDRVPKGELVKELEAAKAALLKLPRELQSSRTDHAERIMDAIFADLRLEEEGEAAAAGSKPRRGGRLVTDDDIHDEDDRLALEAIRRATEGLGPVGTGHGAEDALRSAEAQHALEAAASMIESRRVARAGDPSAGGAGHRHKTTQEEWRESVEQSHAQVRKAREGLAAGPRLPSMRHAEDELAAAQDYLEHELAMLALGQGQDSSGQGAHTPVVTQLLSHASEAIKEAHLRGDDRVAEAQALLMQVVAGADDAGTDPVELRAKIESAERLLAGAALLHADSSAMKAAMQDVDRVQALQELEAAHKQIKDRMAAADPASAAAGAGAHGHDAPYSPSALTSGAERVRRALQDVEDAQHDLTQKPGSVSARATMDKVRRAQEALREVSHEEALKEAAAQAAADQAARLADKAAAEREQAELERLKTEHKPTEYAVKFLDAVSKRLLQLAEKEGLADLEHLGGRDKELVLAAQLVEAIHRVETTAEVKQDLLSKLEELKLSGMTRKDRAKLLRELENRLADADPGGTDGHKSTSGGVGIVDVDKALAARQARSAVEQRLQHEELSDALDELRADPAGPNDPHIAAAIKQLEAVLQELEDDMHRGVVDGNKSAKGGVDGADAAGAGAGGARRAMLKEQQLTHAEDALAAAPKSERVSRAAQFVERVRMRMLHQGSEEPRTPLDKQLSEAASLITAIAQAKSGQDLQAAEELFDKLRRSGFARARGGTPQEREERLAVLNEIFTALEKAASSRPESRARIQRAERLVRDALMDERLAQTETLLQDAEGRGGGPGQAELRGMRERVGEMRSLARLPGALPPSELSGRLAQLERDVEALPTDVHEGGAAGAASLKSMVHDMADAALAAAKREGAAPEAELAEALEELSHVPDSPETQAAKETLATVLHQLRDASLESGGTGKPVDAEAVRALLDEAAERLDADARQHDPHVHKAIQLLDLAEAQREVEGAASIIADAAAYSPSLLRAHQLLVQARTVLDASTRGASFKANLLRILGQAARRIERCGIRSDDITQAGARVRRAIGVLRRHDDELLAQRQQSLDKVEELLGTLKDLPQLPSAKLNPRKRSQAVDDLQRKVEEARKRRPGDSARHLILPAKPTWRDLGLGLEIDEWQNCTNAPGHHLAGRQCVPDAVCTPASCNQHGLCSVVEGSVTCLCNPGFVTVGNRFCSACASRAAAYPDCFTRDLTDDYVRDSLAADVCTAPMLPTTLNGPGLLHTALRTMHIQDKYFLNTAVSSHLITVVVPEESLLRVHTFASHPDLHASDRPVTLRLALPDAQVVVHEGTKFFGQQESVLAAILAPNVAYQLVVEYDGPTVAKQAAARGDKCPTLRMELSLTAASTLDTYKNMVMQDALLQAADQHMGVDGNADHTSLPTVGFGAMPDGVPEAVVEAVARGDALPSHVAAQAAGHGGCDALPRVPTFELGADGYFQVPPGGHYQEEKLAVLTGQMGRGHILQDGVKGSATGPAVDNHAGGSAAPGGGLYDGTAPAGGGADGAPSSTSRPDFDLGVETTVYMLPFRVPEVAERHAYLEADLEFGFEYAALRLLLRNEKTGMLFLAHVAINTNRVRVPVTPGDYTLIIMLLKPHPAPVPERPETLPHLRGAALAAQGGAGAASLHNELAERALLTVTMPECVMYTLKFKVDFVAMPEVPPGEHLTQNDILVEDCEYSLLPPHLNVPGLMGYYGRRLHLFETFRYEALRPLRFVHFEVAVPSMVRIAVPAHHNQQDVTVRLVRLDHPFNAQFDNEEDERRAREAAEDHAFAEAEAEDDKVTLQDIDKRASDLLGEQGRHHTGRRSGGRVSGAAGEAESDAIHSHQHISRKRRRAAGPDARLISMGFISKKRKVSTIVAEVDPGSYRLDVRTPRSQVLAPTESGCEGFTMEMTVVPENEAENMSRAQCRSTAPHAPVIPGELVVGLTVLGAKHEAPVTEPEHHPAHDGGAGRPHGSGDGTAQLEEDTSPRDMFSALMQSSQRKTEAVSELTQHQLRTNAKARSLLYAYVAHVPESRWHDRKPITTWEFWVNQLPPGETSVQLEVELESDFARVPLLAVLEESQEDSDKAAAEAAAANAAAEQVSNARRGAGVMTGDALLGQSSRDLADQLLDKANKVKEEGWPALMVDRNMQVLRRQLRPGLYRLALYLLAPGRFSHVAAEHRDVEDDFACVEYDLRLTVTAPSQVPMVERCMHRTPTRPGLFSLPRSLNTLRFLGSDMLATQGVLAGRFALPRMLHVAGTERSLVQRIIDDRSHEQAERRGDEHVAESSVSRMEVVLPSASLFRVALDSEAAPVTFKLQRHMCLARPGEPFERQPPGQENHVMPWGKYDMQREMGRHAPGCIHEVLSSVSGRFTFVRFLDPGLYELVIEQSEGSVTQDAAAASDCAGYQLQVAVSALHALQSPEVLPDRIFPPEVLGRDSEMHGGRRPGAYEDPALAGMYGEEARQEQARERKLHPNYRPSAVLAELNRASNFIPLCPNLGSDHFPPSPPKVVESFYLYDSVRTNEHLFLQQRHRAPRYHTMRFTTRHSFRLFASVGFSLLHSHLTVSLTALNGIDHGLLEFNGHTRGNRHTVAVDVAPAGDWLLALSEAPTPLENTDNMGVFCAYFTFKLEIEPLAPPSDALVPAALGIPHAFLLVSALQRVLPRYPQLPYTLNSPAFLVPHHSFHHFAAYSLLPMARRTGSVEHAARYARNEMRFVLYHRSLVRVLVTPALRLHIDAHFSVRIILDCAACDSILVAREVTVHNTRLYSWLFGTLNPGHYTVTLLPRTAALPHTWFTARGALDVQMELAIAPVEHVLRALPMPCPLLSEAAFTVCDHVQTIWVQREDAPHDALSVHEEKAICAGLQGQRVYTLTLALRRQSTVAVQLHFDFLMTALMPAVTDIVNGHRWQGERLINTYQLFAVLPAGFYNLTIDSLGRRAEDLVHDNCLRDTYGLSVQVTPAAEASHAEGDAGSWLKSQALAHAQLKRDAQVSATGRAEHQALVDFTGPRVSDEEKQSIWARVAELQGRLVVNVREKHADMASAGETQSSARAAAAHCADPLLPQYLLPVPPSLHGSTAPPEATHPLVRGATSSGSSEATGSPLARAHNRASESGETDDEAAAIDAARAAESGEQPLAIVHSPGAYMRLSAPAMRAAPLDDSAVGGNNPGAGHTSGGTGGAAGAAEDRGGEGESPLHEIKVRVREESLLIVDIRAHTPTVAHRAAELWAVDEHLRRVSEDPQGVDVMPRQVYEFARGQRHTKVFWLPGTYPRERLGPYQFLLQLGASYDPHAIDDADVEHAALVAGGGASDAGYAVGLSTPAELAAASGRIKARAAATKAALGLGGVGDECHGYALEMALVPLEALQAQLMHDDGCREALPPLTVPFDKRGKASVAVDSGAWQSGQLDDLHHTKTHRMSLHVMEPSVLSAGFSYPFVAASFRLVLYRMEDDGHTYEVFRARPTGLLRDAKGEPVSRGLHEVPLSRAATAQDSVLELSVKVQPGNYYLELQEQLSTAMHALVGRLMVHRAAPHDASEAERKLAEDEARARASKPFCVPFRFRLELTPNFLVLREQHGTGATLLSDAPHGANPLESGSCKPHTCGCRNVDVFAHTRKSGAPSGAMALEARLPEDLEAADCAAAGVCLATADGLQHAAVQCHCSEGFAGARCDRCDETQGFGGTYPNCHLGDHAGAAAARALEELHAQTEQARVDAMHGDPLKAALTEGGPLSPRHFAQLVGLHEGTPSPHPIDLVNRQGSGAGQGQGQSTGSAIDQANAMFEASLPSHLHRRAGAGRPLTMPSLPPLEHSYEHTGFDGRPIMIPTPSPHELRVASEAVPAHERQLCDRPCLLGFCDHRTGRCVSYTTDTDPKAIALIAARRAAAAAAAARARDGEVRVTPEQQRREAVKTVVHSTWQGRLGYRLMWIFAVAGAIAVITMLAGLLRRLLPDRLPPSMQQVLRAAGSGSRSGGGRAADDDRRLVLKGHPANGSGRSRSGSRAAAADADADGSDSGGDDHAPFKPVASRLSGSASAAGGGQGRPVVAAWGAVDDDNSEPETDAGQHSGVDLGSALGARSSSSLGLLPARSSTLHYR